MTDCKRNAKGYRIGGSHPRTELTDHEVELLRQMADTGERPITLARLFGLSKGYVSKLLRGRARPVFP